jgi:uncharacterized protein (TIGR02996 family)
MDEEYFLQAVSASPDDTLVRLVYADWLDERNDPRAEFLRLEARATELSPGHQEVAGVRKRLLELRTAMPSAWLARLGSYRSVGGEPAPPPSRLELAATSLGRPVRFTDAEGYEMEIGAAVVCTQTAAVAYVESRSLWRGHHHDIRYHLRICGVTGERVEWEVESYNPYFGCDVGFLEWYWDRVLLIYREKHQTYICRLGLHSPANYRTITDFWVVDGTQIGYWGYQDQTVRRLALPELTELPAVSEAEATNCQLLPKKFW